MRQQRYWGIFLAILGSTCWGVSGPISEALFEQGVTVSWLISSKMIIAGIILMIVVAIREPHAILSPWRNKKDAFQMLVFVLFGMVGMQYIYFKAVEVANAPTATILQYLSPVMVLVYLAIRQRERPRQIDVAVIVLAMIGMLLVVTRGHVTQLAISPQAFFWGVMAAVAAAAYTLLPAQLLTRHSPLVVTAWAQLLGGLVVDTYQPFWRHIPHLDLVGWAGYGFVLVFGTILAYFVYLASLQFISPTAASLLDAFEPIGATVVAVIFLHMQLTFYELLGGAIIIATVALMAFASPKSPLPDQDS